MSLFTNKQISSYLTQCERDPTRTEINNVTV